MNNSKTEWWQNFFHGIALDLWRQAVTEEMTRAEADFIEKTLRLAPHAKILDAPCGNGRLALELASRGYQPTGVDIASEFIDEARSKSAERQLNVSWKQGDMRDLPWPEEFDGAFCFGNSFGYLDDDGNRDFLRAVAGALKPGARFIVNTPMMVESLLPNFQERRWYQIGDILFLIHNRYDHIVSRVETDYTFIRDGKVDRRFGSQRVYTYREFVQRLEEAGFTHFDGYGSLSQEPFKLGSPTLLMVATKI
jgi:SAM-dependent methyltransferase